MAIDTKLAVIEGKWWKNYNSSVRSTFDIIADQTWSHPHAYYYEMANSPQSFEEAALRVATNSRLKYLCIATHGQASGLTFFDNVPVSGSEISAIFQRILGQPKAKIAGLHFASCSTCTSAFAEEILSNNPDIEWLCGYDKKVDWLESTALDIYFYKQLLSSEETRELSKIDEVAKKMSKVTSGLNKALGFRIFARRDGQIVNLLAD